MKYHQTFFFVSIEKAVIQNMRTSELWRKKTVEDVGEFAVRFYISSPTVFQIRSEKKILQTLFERKTDKINLKRKNIACESTKLFVKIEKKKSESSRVINCDFFQRPLWRGGVPTTAKRKTFKASSSFSFSFPC